MINSVATARLGRRTALAVGVVMLVLGGCGGSGPKEDPSFFTVRAVTLKVAPPCLPPALAEMRDGQAVACYELGPTAVDAKDVESATVVRDATTRTESVEFTLSRTGGERFNTLARTVGVGGQVAILVDGEIVSVPHLQTTEFPGRGVVTGLDAAGARRLAERLDRA